MTRFAPFADLTSILLVAADLAPVRVAVFLTIFFVAFVVTFEAVFLTVFFVDLPADFETELFRATVFFVALRVLVVDFFVVVLGI
jgi:hypothetical protein